MNKSSSKRWMSCEYLATFNVIIIDRKVMNMKAYVMNEERKMIVKDMPEPIPTESNAIIDVKYASICGTDFRTFTKGNEKTG